MDSPKGPVDAKYTIEVAEWNEEEPSVVVICRVCGKVATYEQPNDAQEAARAHLAIHEDPDLYEYNEEETAAFRFEGAHSVSDLEV